MPCTRGNFSGQDIIGIPVIATASGDDARDRHSGTVLQRVIGITKFKGGILGVVHVVNHHAVNPVVIGRKTVPREIKVVVLRQTQIDNQAETLLRKKRVSA